MVYPPYLGIKEHGWTTELIDYIKQRTSTEDHFLVSDSKEFELLSGRVAISFQELRPLKTFENLAEAIIKNEIKYVLFDNYTFSYLLQLIELCKSIIIPLEIFIPEEAILFLLEKCTIPANTIALQLVYQSKSEDGILIRLYKVIYGSELTFDILLKEGFLGGEWNAGNNGKILAWNNSSKLIIGDEMNYTFSYRKTPLNLTFDDHNVKFFAWKVTKVDNAEVRRIEFWSNDRRHLMNIIPPSAPGIWITYFDVTDMGDIRVVIAGNPGGYLIVEWIAIGTLQLTN